jgi:hypothetical protein
VFKKKEVHSEAILEISGLLIQKRPESTLQKMHLCTKPRLRLRRPGRTHWFRWEDELRRYAEHMSWQSWQSVAHNPEVWAEHSKLFVKYTAK